MSPARLLALSTGLAAVLWSAGCAEPPKPALGLSEVIARPAENALLAGMRAYEDGQYAEAEKALQKALAASLQSPRDQASAHKLLAFIYCTSNRMAPCEQAFRAARQADPGFALSRSEAGHPLWGPVYRKVAGS